MLTVTSLRTKSVIWRTTELWDTFGPPDGFEMARGMGCKLGQHARPGTLSDIANGPYLGRPGTNQGLSVYDAATSGPKALHATAREPARSVFATCVWLGLGSLQVPGH